MRPCSLALLHHPVLDGSSAVVTTAVTNLDVHDLARSARTYGCDAYFVVHPIEAQRALVERIRAHWVEGSGGKRIPDRREALGLVRLVASLDDALAAMGGRANVEVWATAARPLAAGLRFAEAHARLRREGPPILLVFGTGWGLAPSVIDLADALLEPVVAERPGYNHLSVRAAAAIVLDRLLGRHD